jgi:hypothetical protein
MRYSAPPDRRPMPVNGLHLARLPFKVAELPAAVAAVSRVGGRLQGEITAFRVGARASLIVYKRDPEALSWNWNNAAARAGAGRDRPRGQARVSVRVVQSPITSVSSGVNPASP